MSEVLDKELFLPKPRVQFGKYRFVEINPNIKIPIFRCGTKRKADDDCTIPFKSMKEDAVTNEIQSSHFNTSTSIFQPHPLNANGIVNLQPSYPNDTSRSLNAIGFSNNLNAFVNDGSKRMLPVPPENFHDSFDDEPMPSSPVAFHDSFDDAECDWLVGKSDTLDETAVAQTATAIAQTAVVPNYYIGLGQRYDMHGKFKTYLKDDGDAFMDSAKVLGFQRHTQLFQALKNVFGHNDFRLRQKAAIVAILNNFDCFILMPTGAGKSLCYQLPAILSVGVTIVISPLISLIADQVTKLKSLNIEVRDLKSSTSGANDSAKIYHELEQSHVSIKLLYATPEMIGKSPRFVSCMQSLHQRGLLSRIVVDEAHCISQWGHDFRPEYTRLNVFINNFKNPRVPVIALTATATPKIVTDVRAHLALSNSKLFMSSFVRDNLKYDVHQKTAHSIRRLIVELKIKYGDSSGIVYCLYQRETESIVEAFRKEGFSAEPYHAGLPDSKRTTVQNDWMSGKVSVICATIAFGMGIDKPNVRFIVHHSLPKSIESYYQETGRAGRDGLSSYCLLLYSYQDHIRIRQLQERNIKASNTEIGRQHKDSLYEMVNYCENVLTCRRKILVEHFGEIYDVAACQSSLTPCSICESFSAINKSYQLYDITEDCRILISGIRAMNNATISYVAELYRDALSKKNKEKALKLNHTALPLYKRGNALSEADSVRILRKLVIDGYLYEFLQTIQQGGLYGTIFPSNKGLELANQQISTKVYIHLSCGGKKGAANNKNDVHFSMTKVTESAALKEKYRLKHPDLFTKCKAALLQLFQGIARENNYPSYSTVISLEGLDQLSALMPRTNTELLHIDSMTQDKVTNYSAQIMGILKQFWTESDKREHDQIKHQVDHLKSITASGYSASPPLSSNGYNSRTKSPSSYGRRSSHGIVDNGVGSKFKTTTERKGFDAPKKGFGNGKVTKRTTTKASTTKSKGTSAASKARATFLFPNDKSKETAAASRARATFLFPNDI